MKSMKKLVLAGLVLLASVMTLAGCKNDSVPETPKYTVRKLTSLSIIPPTRTVYAAGDEFDSTGMVVTAKYDDGETREVNTWTTDFDEITSKHGLEKTVTVSYSEGEITQSTTFTVVVFPEDVKVLTDYKSPNHTDDTWTYVAFGEWPQTKANVEGISLQQVDGGRGYFKDNYYTDGKGNYYVKVTANPYENTYKYSDETVVTEDSEVYFKVEPIVWRVLTDNYLVPGENGTKIASGNALLLAENILTGGIPYYVDKVTRTITGEGTKEEESDTVYPNNYKYSTIRAWLNGSYETDDTQEKNYEGKGFLQTAFTDEALKCIAETTVDNTARSTNPDSNASQRNGGDNPYACGNTEDKIFLLSEQEASTEGYGFAAYDAGGEDNTRIRVTTDYAKATGAFQASTAGYGGVWWLRSPEYSSDDSVCDIYVHGYAMDAANVGFNDLGVVPALSISMNGN